VAISGAGPRAGGPWLGGPLGRTVRSLHGYDPPQSFPEMIARHQRPSSVTHRLARHRSQASAPPSCETLMTPLFPPTQPFGSAKDFSLITEDLAANARIAGQMDQAGSVEVSG